MDAPVRSVLRRPEDTQLFLPTIWIMCAAGPALGLIGQAYVVLPCIWLLYALLHHRAPPFWLSAFLLCNLIVIVLSFYRVMPSSWQVLYSHYAIFRQSVPVIGFFCATWASYCYFRERISENTVMRDSGSILFFVFLVMPAVNLALGALASDIYNSYATFTNPVSIASVYILIWLFDFRQGVSRAITMMAIVFVAATTSFSQLKVFAAVLLAVYLGLAPRLATAVLMLGLVTLYSVGQFYIADIYRLDGNTAIRLLFTRDVIESVSDTFGLGIGYGTESVRAYFEFHGAGENQFLPPFHELPPKELLKAMATGVHNSFLQALLRTGLIGFFTLICLFEFCAPRGWLRDEERRSGFMILCFAFLACFVNPALESPLQLGGVAFAVGYLLAVRAASASGRDETHTLSDGVNLQERAGWSA